MKIALCAQNNTPDAPIDTRFGRAACFAVCDTETGNWQFAPNNQNLQAAQGAGIQAAQHLLDAQADVLIACNVGPKAMAALTAAGVKIAQCPAGLSLRQAVEEFKSGKLQMLTEANVEGHWG
jgi:predicted Fe-Mo cluster-binding NifX family protein